MELRRALTLRRQRRVWSGRVEGWDASPPPGLEKVVAAVLEQAATVPATLAVDLGCGTGQVSLPLARQAGRVIAVDIIPEMVERLIVNAEREGLTNVEGRAAAVEELDLAPGSVDVVVSNYALHHLRDADKALVVGRIARWLRPGGLVVVGDMMFGRGGDPRDREIIVSKVSALLRRGPAGWWRVAKNGFRFLLRVQERPVSIGRWEAMLTEAGFEGVGSRAVVAEAAVVWGRRPEGRAES